MTPGDSDHRGDSPTRTPRSSIPSDAGASAGRAGQGAQGVINTSTEIRRPVRLDGFDVTMQGPDLSRPNAARVYDYFLDGGMNYGIDQEFAREAMTIFPAIKEGARDNRGFLGRAVRYLVSQGVRQFLDLGCGIPSVGSSWEIATHERLDARVVCVDNEPVAVHATEDAIQKDPERHKHVDVIQADLTDPDTVLKNPFVRGVLDLNRPIGVLMVAVMHFVGPGDQPRDLIKQYMSRAAAGSYIALSVAASDDAPLSQQAQLDQFVKKYENTSSPLYLRRHNEVRSWLDGLELVSPTTGQPDVTTPLVHLDDWMPDDTGPSPRKVSEAHGCAWCGVARKPNSYPRTDSTI